VPKYRSLSRIISGPGSRVPRSPERFVTYVSVQSSVRRFGLPRFDDGKKSNPPSLIFFLGGSTAVLRNGRTIAYLHRAAADKLIMGACGFGFVPFSLPHGVTAPSPNIAVADFD
jgi:hypothetical protein